MQSGQPLILCNVHIYIYIYIYIEHSTSIDFRRFFLFKLFIEEYNKHKAVKEWKSYLTLAERMRSELEGFSDFELSVGVGFEQLYIRNDILEILN